MSDFIVAKEIGLTVFGQAQVDYTANGYGSLDFGMAMVQTGLARASSMENAMREISQAVRVRQTKLSELGNALADITEAIAKKSDSISNKTQISSSAVKILRRYGFSVSASDTVGNYQKLQSNVRLSMDKESTSLKEDSSALQTYLSRRDNAYSMASKMLKKAQSTISSGINNIGG